MPSSPESRCISHLTALVEERLRGEQDVYREVVEQQYRALSDYDGPQARKRLQTALEAAGLGYVARKLDRDSLVA